MKRLISCLFLSFCLYSCENQEEFQPGTDWQRLRIDTDLDLKKVYLVNEQVAYISATPAIESSDINYIFNINPDEKIDYRTEQYIFTDSAKYCKVIYTTQPQEVAPALFKTVDGGKSWIPLPTPFASEISDLDFIDEEVGFAATYHQGVYKTEDGGATWKLVLNNIGTFDEGFLLKNPFEQLTFINSQVGYAYDPHYNLTFKTQDGGYSWRFVTAFGDYSQHGSGLKAIDFPAGEQIGYANCRSAFLKTTDGGESWQSLVNNIKDFRFIDANTGWYMTDNNLYSTRDGGQSWQEVSNMPQLVSYERQLEVSSNNTMFLYGSDRGISFLKDGESTPVQMGGVSTSTIVNDFDIYGNIGLLVGNDGLLMKYEAPQ